MDDVKQTIEWLLSRGVQITFDAPTPEYFRLAMRWKGGPNGRHKRKITLRGFDLFKLLQKAVCQIDELLPVKISSPVVETEAGEGG